MSPPTKRQLILLICLFLIPWVTVGNALADDDELSSVWVSGPTSVNDGASIQLKAYAKIGSDTRDITSRARWSLSSTQYASISYGKLTAKNVPSCQNQTVTVNIRYSRDGITRTDTHDVAIVDNECSTPPPPPAVTLASISIGGPASMNENTAADFPVTATMSDSSTKAVTATLTENSTFTSFSGIRLTATAVTGTQTVSIGASYTEGGVTKTAAKTVSILDTTTPPPVTGSHAGRFDSYAGATTCLPCHRTQAQAVYSSEHYQWSGKFGAINDFCIYPDINMIGKLTNVNGIEVDGGCLKCHVGMGAKPVKTATPTDAQLANIDCLVCHAPKYKRTVDPVTKAKYIPDETAMGMTILEAAVDIQPTSRDTCLNCHTKSGGGNNFKRGDIEEHHRNPTTRAFDVHMSPASLGGGEMQCTTCHTVSNHKISGKGADLRVEEGTKPDCIKCHTATPPHTNTNINSYHVKRVDCTTCHIPTYAKVAPTDTHRDWSAFGELNVATGLYDPARVMQGNLTPVYKFWNGTTSTFYNFGTPATTVDPADGTVVMAEPVGSVTTLGAKIHPFKLHTAKQPYDLVTDFLLPLKIGRFYMEGDLVNAIPLGQDGVGWARNPYGYKDTKRYLGLFHEVSPKENALGTSCTTCHGTTTPRIPLKTMGYTAKKPTSDLCNDCHGSQSYSFSNVHPRHTQRGINCSSCHNFSRAQ